MDFKRSSFSSQVKFLDILLEKPDQNTNRNVFFMLCISALPLYMCVILCLLQLPICAGIWIKHQARDREETCFQKWVVMETALLNRIALGFNFSLYGAARQE